LRILESSAFRQSSFLVVVGLVYWFLKATKATEVGVQEVVHKLEEGGWVWRVKVVILLSALAFMTYLWFFREVGGFKGLANEK